MQIELIYGTFSAIAETGRILVNKVSYDYKELGISIFKDVKELISIFYGIL